MRRPRGPGGRFLTQAEVEAQGLDPEGLLGGSGSPGSGDDASTPDGSRSGAPKKRKASQAGGVKKKKKGSASPTPPDNNEDGTVGDTADAAA